MHLPSSSNGRSKNNSPCKPATAVDEVDHRHGQIPCHQQLLSESPFTFSGLGSMRPWRQKWMRQSIAMFLHHDSPLFIPVAHVCDSRTLESNSGESKWCNLRALDFNGALISPLAEPLTASDNDNYVGVVPVMSNIFQQLRWRMSSFTSAFQLS